MAVKINQLESCCGVILVSHLGESPDGNDLYTVETIRDNLRKAYNDHLKQRAFLLATLNDFEYEKFHGVFEKEGWKLCIRPTLNPRTRRYIYTYFKRLVDEKNIKDWKKGKQYRNREDDD